MSIVTPLVQAILDADHSLVAAVNAYAGAERLFDHGMVLITGLPLVKFLPMVAMLWWLWGTRQALIQARVWAVGLGAALAFGLARLASHALPFRPRPLHDPQMVFHLPDGADAHALQLWSAFPSDHAAILGALCGGLFLIRPLLGVGFALYGLVFVMLPRLYLGLHYPSDLLVGFLLGSASAVVLQHPAVLARVAWPTTRWAQGHLPSFMMMAFVSSYFLATNADDVRRMVGLLKQAF